MMRINKILPVMLMFMMLGIRVCTQARKDYQLSSKQSSNLSPQLSKSFKQTVLYEK